VSGFRRLPNEGSPWAGVGRHPVRMLLRWNHLRRLMPGLAVCLLASAVIGLAQTATEGPYQLDAVCFLPRNLPKTLAPGNPAASTRRMAALLQKLDREVDPRAVAYLSDRVVKKLEVIVQNAANAAEQVNFRLLLARQQMQSGRPDHALNTYAELDRLMAQYRIGLGPEGQAEVRFSRGVAFLRMGEQENCIGLHTAESCLFPLSAAARHRLPRGSRGAIAQFEEQLRQNPEDLGARWLLNIAYMTLGEYPEKVPPAWLIPAAIFASEHPMPRFPDVAGPLGLDVSDLAGGVIVDDFDNDGFLDVVASAWALTGQLRFFRNLGNGTFEERTSEAGLVGITGGLHICQTDYNNDGHLDVWVPRGAWMAKAGRIPPSLLRNNGDGTFTDVTEEAGLMRAHPSQTCRWFDYDRDGHLDLFVGNESSDPADPDRCELFHNNGNGTFTECAIASGIRVAQFVKGVACADYDHDGYEDLYLSVRDGPNILLRNNGPKAATNGVAGGWKFSEVTKVAGVGEPYFSFPTWFFDYDNDGWEDLFCSGYGINNIGDAIRDYLHLPTPAAFPKMYRNNRNGTFTDVTEQVGMQRVCLTMGSNFGDLDNDGWLDFYLGTGDPDLTTVLPNRMFRNDGGKRFQEVTTATGTGHLQKGHAVSFADLDNDGDQDVYARMGGAFTGDTARNALFLNPGTTNGWLRLRLVGTRSNRAAIGARIEVRLTTPQGPRSLFRTVGSGGSFGANPLRLEIGLGDATGVESIVVHWPAGTPPQTVRGFQLNRAYEVREGTAEPSEAPQRPLQLRIAG
jgi:hypothetical protein